MIPEIEYLDLGYELSVHIEPYLNSSQLPFLAAEIISDLISGNLKFNPVIGKYVALRNWGIVFEPSLQLDVMSLLKKHSMHNALIMQNVEGLTHGYIYGGKNPMQMIDKEQLFALEL